MTEVNTSADILAALDYMDIVNLINEYGSERKVVKALGIPRTTFQLHRQKVTLAFFRDRPPLKAVRINPDPNKILRFIYTSAQDQTAVHLPFWNNLKAFADYYEAEIKVSPFTYNKSLFEDHRPEVATYAAEIRPYLNMNREEIGPNLQWCGEMNTLPTAVNPLSGFESYAQTRSGIYPHAKVQLQSLGRVSKDGQPRFLMTTGCVTKENYVRKKAGLKGEFNHIFGAVFVELHPDGNFIARHLMAERDGSFQDLDIKVQNGEITFDHRVESITHGDIHFEQMDQSVADLVWRNSQSLVDVLKPKYQFFHDVLDFGNRSYHNANDPHQRFLVMINGEETIEDSMKGIGEFLKETWRPFSKSIVVESNHDRHYLKYLKDTDWRDDLPNAELNLWANAEILAAYKRGEEKTFNIFEHTVRRYAPGLDVHFLREDDSFITCAGDRAGIENGLHGHLGTNGSRGSVRGLAKLGPRTNTAHTHAPTIYDGAYCAGTYSNLDLGYNRGPSNWAHAAIITYPSGKRAMCIFTNGMWRSPLD